jgi:RecB family exonuclease
MFNLICGSAVTTAMRRLLSQGVRRELLRLLAETGPVAIGEDSVITFDAMLERLTAPHLKPETDVPRTITSAVVRNIIDSQPAAYDYLVGKHSVPRMSQGVLDRIVAAMTTVRKKTATEESVEAAPVSPRERQLEVLAAAFEKRLSDSGCRQLEHAQMEALANVSKDVWNAQFGHITQAVFLDFISHSDAHFMLVHAVSKNVPDCNLILDFDPELDASASAMDAVYQRYYDMADNLVLSPEDLLMDDADGPAPAGQAQPLVVTAKTVAQEVHGAAAAIRRLLDDAPDDDKPSIVVALTNWGDYAPALDKVFEDFAIQAVWKESEQVIRGGEWLLLDRLRHCSGKSITGADLAALFRAPGFTALLPEPIPSVEVWDLASRLDSVLTLTGQVPGWRLILASVQAVLRNLQAERKRSAQWSEEEAVQDLRLIDLLKQTQALLQPYTRQSTVGDWCQLVAKTYRLVEASWKASDGELAVARRRELKKSLLNMSRFGSLVSDVPITFSYFLTLYKTATYREWVGNEPSYQSRPVTVCSPSDAGKIRSNCCIVLGCNDGNFPQFAKPDAQFFGYSFQSSQTAARARQRIVLEQILRNHARVLLWMPQRLGVEELLPSQFIEDLLAAGRCAGVTVDTLLAGMKANTYGSGHQLQQELVESLRGLVLTPGEVQRFAQRGRLMFNIASNMSVHASRAQAQMSGYDGIITDPHLKEWLAHWADRHIYSVSQLDSIVGCSFRFFVDRMLHLEELEEADDLLPAHLFGSFTHNVLARFYRDWVAAGRGVPKAGDEWLAREKLLEAYYIEHEKFPDASDFARDLLHLKLFGELGAEGFGSNLRALDDVLDPGVLGQFLQMEMARGADHIDFLKPSNFEVGFGMGRQEQDDPLTLPDPVELDIGAGEEIRLRGRIDRIDISSDGTFAVTDYKSGRLPEKKEIIKGYKTQLPVYLLVAEQLLSGTFQDPEAAGGLYYSLRKGANNTVSGVFFRAAFQKQAGVTGRGLKDEEFVATLDKVKSHMRHSLKAVRRGMLTSTRHDPAIVCKFCPFDGFCYKNVERTDTFWQGIEADEGSAHAL